MGQSTIVRPYSCCWIHLYLGILYRHLDSFIQSVDITSFQIFVAVVRIAGRNWRNPACGLKYGAMWLANTSSHGGKGYHALWNSHTNGVELSSSQTWSFCWEVFIRVFDLTDDICPDQNCEKSSRSSAWNTERECMAFMTLYEDDICQGWHSSRWKKNCHFCLASAEWCRLMGFQKQNGKYGIKGQSHSRPLDRSPEQKGYCSIK